MAAKLSQSLKQTQTLAMTPQLQQAIKLLTLTHLEMTTVIAEEMMENPLLEELGEEVGGEEKREEEDYQIENLEMQNQEATIQNFEEAPIMSKDDDFDWQAYVEAHENSTYTPPNMATVDPDEITNYENMITKGVTLPEHLEWQIRMENLTDAEINLAQEIIHNINDDGYLEISFDEIIAKTGHDREDAFEILKMIKKLDPVGCGSADLIECLLVQAEVLIPRSLLLEKMIQNHMSDLQVKNYEKISKDLSVPIEKIKEAQLILQSFHPKPGRLIAGEETQYVVPDIYVTEVSGKFVVGLNDDGVPRLKISKLYQEMLKQSHDKGAQEYVQDKLRAAMWLIKSIQNRQKTIIKVSQALVAHQQEFFRHGPERLKPMILRDIAIEIGMHESTVSRVTTNKYMHTPIGLFELKYFFNTGVGGKNGGEEISNEVMKLKIKKLIESENPAKPLSDQKIAELIGLEGMQLARRTVAKYREALGIVSSSDRKKIA